MDTILRLVGLIQGKVTADQMANLAGSLLANQYLLSSRCVREVTMVSIQCMALWCKGQWSR